MFGVSTLRSRSALSKTRLRRTIRVYGEELTGMDQNGPIDVAVGANLKRLREEVGLSAEELAAACGCEPEVVRKGETGAHRLRASELFQMAQRLQQPVSAFFKGLTPEGPLRIGSVAEDGDDGGYVEIERR